MAATDDPGAARPDPADAAVEYAKCLADCAYFLNEYGVIDDAQGHGEGGGTMPFRLWAAQVDIIWKLMIAPLVIILKARQLGISWICCGYALWLCLFRPGKVVLLFSQGQLEADEMLRRVRALYERLPDWLRDACPLAKDPNTSEMTWANGSVIRSLPATQKAGRSFTASLVIMDEAAHMQWAGPLYTALKPTIDGGGQLVILSTANGIGNLFHLLWARAVAGTAQFLAIFLPWRARPGRDHAWYDAKVAEESEPGKTKQEYPESASEAFLVSGRVRFDAAWIAGQDANGAVAPLDPAGLPGGLSDLDGLIVYRAAERGRRCLIAADVAEGLEHRDYSSAVVVDDGTWEELADLHGHWEPDEFARRLSLLSAAYGNAPVIPERNNHGFAVISKLKSLGVPVANGHDDRPGWLSNPQTKPQAVDALAVALRDGLATIRTAATLGEMLIYRIEPNGGTSAPAGYHDDRVMKWAVLLGWIRVVGSHGPGVIAGPGTSAGTERRTPLEAGRGDGPGDRDGGRDRDKNRRGDGRRGSGGAGGGKGLYGRG